MTTVGVHDPQSRRSAMAHYGDAHVADAYARSRAAVPAIVTALRDGGQVTGRSRILEIGCGTGNYICALTETTGCTGFGLDRSEAMLRHARSRTGQVGLLRGDAAHFGFPDRSFDLVFSVDVIHHVGARDRYYAEAHRVLRPQGRVCTMTHSEDLIRDSLVLSRYFPATVPRNLARYPSPSALRKLMTLAGFYDVSEAIVSEFVEVADSSLYANKAYSVLHQIPEEVFQRGLACLERDLAIAPIRGVRRYLALWGTK